MKTRIIIEFETKNMKKVVPEEYIGKNEECPEDELLTNDVEKILHERFEKYVDMQFTEVDNNLKDFLMDEEASVEGFDSLSDYGDLSIKVINETEKEVEQK